MAEVGLEYVSYRSLQQRSALANQNLAAQQSTLDLTRRLFDAGLAVAQATVAR
jgi:outer membrane protein TolC